MFFKKQGCKPHLKKTTACDNLTSDSDTKRLFTNTCFSLYFVSQPLTSLNIIWKLSAIPYLLFQTCLLSTELAKVTQ